MMFVRSLRVSGFTVMACCLILLGCKGGGSKEPPTVKVTGRVVENGQPVAIQEFHTGYNCLQVEFCPVDASGKLINAPHYATFPDKDGSFTFGGGKAQGIPAGKYRVVIRRWDRMPKSSTKPPDPSGNVDAWEGKYDADKSPFIADVTGKGEIVIDLAKPPAKG